MAQVYLAHDLLLGRPVALKVLFSELSADRAFVERFRREAQAAANLSHPNIVPVFDWGEDRFTYFIVMEYVDGEALSSIIRTQAPLTPAQTASRRRTSPRRSPTRTATGSCTATSSRATSSSPPTGQVKVTDFGIARAIGADEQITQTGLVMGTATYFSPEQAQGLGVDGRSDIYALGVVLYEMVAGRPPSSATHRSRSPTSTSGSIRPRARLQPGRAAGPRGDHHEGLAKSPAHRYPTADEFRADLLRFREGRAVGAVAPPMMPTNVGTTQAVPYGATQTLHQIAGQEPEEPERSRTGLYAAVLIALLAALAVVIIFLGQSLGWWHQSGGNTTVSLPDVTGQTVTAAEHNLHVAGLKTSVHPTPPPLPCPTPRSSGPSRPRAPPSRRAPRWRSSPAAAGRRSRSRAAWSGSR